LSFQFIAVLARRIRRQYQTAVQLWLSSDSRSSRRLPFPGGARDRSPNVEELARGAFHSQRRKSLGCLDGFRGLILLTNAPGDGIRGIPPKASCILLSETARNAMKLMTSRQKSAYFSEDVGLAQALAKLSARETNSPTSFNSCTNHCERTA
jgi:hypothetical protein